MDNRLLIPLLFLAVWLCLATPGRAQLAYPGNWQQSTNWQRNGATLDLDFVNDRYWLGTTGSPFTGTSYSGIVSFISASGATFTRSTTATYFDANGVMQTAAANTPRLDHDPATGAAKGVLIEESRTNLIPYAQQLENWTRLDVNGGAGSVSQNTTVAPDGTTTADTLNNNGTGSGNSYFYRILSPTAPSGTTFNFSIWVKNLVGSARIDVGGLSDVVSFTTLNILSGSTWTRYNISVTTNATNGKVYPQVSLLSAGSSVVVWGGQLEQGPNPTSYIPTTSGAVTRAADTFSIPAGTWYAGTVGTFFSEQYGQGDSTGVGRIVGIYASGAAPLVYNSGPANIRNWDGTTGPGVTSPVTPSSTVWIKSAAAWDDAITTSSISAGGTAAVTGSYTAGVYNHSPIYVGSSTSNNYYLNSWIRRLGYFPTRQPAASLTDYTR